MNKFSLKIKIALLTPILLLAWFGDAGAATNIYSPANNSTYTVNTNITFRWNRTSNFNYISIWNGSWGAWQNLGNKISYGPTTRSSDGWLGAQVATWESNQWWYSNVVWVYFYTPTPPPPPPPPAPGSPNLWRSPSDPVYKGDTVTFNWSKPANTADFYIIYRRNGVWDASWAWVGLAQNRSFTDTLNLDELAAQVAACNSSGCGYSNVPVITLLTKTPSQMNLTPLTSGNTYSGSLSSANDAQYAKITNTTGLEQIYSIRVTANNANISLSMVDGAGNADPSQVVNFSNAYISFRISNNQTRYLKITGTQAGSYNYTFNRFRNFPFFEGL